MPIPMYRRVVKFIASSTIVLLVFVTCDGVNAKHNNCSSILESEQYRDIVSLLAPQKIFADHDNADGTHNEAWLQSTCRRDLLIWQEAIRRRELWALMMLDASSKLPSGLLQGNIIDLGQFDECMAIQSNTLDNNIRGRHCMYTISPTTKGDYSIPIDPTLSVCLPATCSSYDIISFFNATISRNDKLKDLKVEIASATCSTVDPTVWDLEFTLCLTILSGFVIFLVVCTVIEMSHKNFATDGDNHPFVSSLAAFSLRKSAASILNMNTKEGTLRALNGIRSLSTISIVLFHQYNNIPAGLMANTCDYIKWEKSWSSSLIDVNLYSVDTFFVLSAFLMTYLFLKQMPKKKKFNIPMYYLHRYVRLTPSLIGLLVFTIVILPKLGSGALWESRSRYYTDYGRSTWWIYFLYVQNFVNKYRMYLPHLWYLAVDMQLFWISPLILYPLYKKPKFGLSILAVLFLASLAYSALVIGIRRLPVVSSPYSHKSNVTTEILGDIYISPFHRAGAWLVGIFLGYEMAMHKRLLERWTLIAGWSIAIASFAFCSIGIGFFMDPDYEYNAVWETFFSVVARPVWAIGISWVIYACLNNRAGSITSILSLRVFGPLGKLSYCVYILHPVIQKAYVFSMRTPAYFLAYDTWHSFFSTLVLSIGAAFLLSLLFEVPFMVLEGMLFRSKRESHSQNKSEETRTENGN